MSGKNVFVDTNIFLGFYPLDKDKFKHLEEFLEKIKKGEVKLWTSSHQLDEILRNKETVISKQIEKANKFIAKIALEKEFPDLCSEEFKEFSTKVKKNIEEYKTKAYQESLEIDLIIKKIFEKATKVQSNSEIINKAKERALIKGNPPRKENSSFRSCGDAINWECLLAGLPNGEDLFVISTDEDYTSKIDETKISLFLKNEWNVKKKSSVVLNSSIASFLSSVFKVQGIKKEAIKSEESSSKYVSSLEKNTGSVFTHVDYIPAWKTFSVTSEPEKENHPVIRIPTFRFQSDIKLPDKPIQTAGMVICQSCSSVFYPESMYSTLKQCPFCGSYNYL